MGQSWPLFVLFSSFSHSNIKYRFYFNLGTYFLRVFYYPGNFSNDVRERERERKHWESVWEREAETLRKRERERERERDRERERKGASEKVCFEPSFSIIRVLSGIAKFPFELKTFKFVLILRTLFYVMPLWLSSHWIYLVIVARSWCLVGT